jgi:hypothetical protein
MAATMTRANREAVPGSFSFERLASTVSAGNLEFAEEGQRRSRLAPLLLTLPEFEVLQMCETGLRSNCSAMKRMCSFVDLLTQEAVQLLLCAAIQALQMSAAALSAFKSAFTGSGLENRGRDRKSRDGASIQRGYCAGCRSEELFCRAT